jgi:trans-2,3-dihydro-3-hydroxyanthranilate isomerase
MRYKFYTCDVFTDERFGGNPLAVLPDAAGLTTEQMQLIAREFNFSESTFVLPAEQGYTRRVRIFTRQTELPFAGHPNVGTAFVLAKIGALDDGEDVVFEENAGIIPITIRKINDQIWCELKAPETLFLGQPFSVEQIAPMLSLSPNDIETSVHLPQQASVGLPFIMIEAKNRTVLEKAMPDASAMRVLQAAGHRPSFHLYTRSDDEFDVRCRMFSPLGGTVEDPATGSANCALTGLLTHYHSEANGEFSFRIGQGIEMGRPSVLDARTEKREGEVVGVWIAGNSVMVTEGFIEI